MNLLWTLGWSIVVTLRDVMPIAVVIVVFQVFVLQGLMELIKERTHETL